MSELETKNYFLSNSARNFHKSNCILRWTWDFFVSPRTSESRSPLSPTPVRPSGLD